MRLDYPLLALALPFPLLCPAELLPSLHHVLTFETVGLPVLLLAAAGAVHS